MCGDAARLRDAAKPSQPVSNPAGKRTYFGGHREGPRMTPEEREAIITGWDAWDAAYNARERPRKREMKWRIDRCPTYGARRFRWWHCIAWGVAAGLLIGIIQRW